MDERREARPGELAESTDADVSQDPGVPGVKFPDAEEPRQGFASNAEKDPGEDSKRADDPPERGQEQGT